jgi:hypothetical protein
MERYKQQMVARSAVWSWLLTRGPHGPSFEWGKRPRTPNRIRDLNYLRESISAQTSTDPSFPVDLRHAALELLAEENPEFIRRALQVLSVVGLNEDADTLKSFLDHDDALVRKDAQASLFELGEKF